ncbi:hypothetical protein SAMN06264365_104111 [Actinoplanes regularis]|uniref:Uncharacterized protein n=1 Tax=Actinoplanes regularis TaxID=52697 RepID=A0A238XY84_9ACTN|nr:hypothetical protein SAMN06264365_104111 [Actinoplanes regularis]
MLATTGPARLMRSPASSVRWSYAPTDLGRPPISGAHRSRAPTDLGRPPISCAHGSRAPIGPMRPPISGAHRLHAPTGLICSPGEPDSPGQTRFQDWPCHSACFAGGRPAWRVPFQDWPCHTACFARWASCLNGPVPGRAFPSGLLRPAGLCPGGPVPGRAFPGGPLRPAGLLQGRSPFPDWRLAVLPASPGGSSCFLDGLSIRVSCSPSGGLLAWVLFHWAGPLSGRSGFIGPVHFTGRVRSGAGPAPLWLPPPEPRTGSPRRSPQPTG